jgi:hypothetical protein
MPNTDTEIDYEASAYVIAAAALSSSEKDWEGLLALIENTDPSLLAPVAFGLGVLAGEAVVPGSDMLSPLAVIQRLMGTRPRTH